MVEKFVIVGSLLALVGCGSGSATSDGGGHGGTVGAGGTGGRGGTGGNTDGGGACAPAVVAGTTDPGTMSWVQNGVPQCAYIIEGTHTIGGGVETLEIIGASTSGPAVGVTVSSYGGVPIGGTYSCGAGLPPAPYVSIEITGHTASGAAQDCMINVSQAGGASAYSIATFSGSVTGEGGVETVSAGMLDTLVALTGGEP